MDQARQVQQVALTAGMNKDLDVMFVKDGQYLNAINAKLNSAEGEYRLLQSEPSNFRCLQLPYDFVGSIPLPGGKYAVFSTTNLASEIGIFDEQNCEYKKIVNSRCLNFNKDHLISGRAKENFDCSISIYWTDGYNPRRFLNLDNPPYKYTVGRDACQTRTYTNEIDCDAMLLQPNLNYPKVSMKLGTDGNIRNGVYQAAVAYSINGQRITDYMSITSPVQVFSHENLGRSLEVNIENLDRDFDEYQLIILYTIVGSTSVDVIGTYNTTQSKVVVTAVGNLATNNKPIPLDDVITPTVIYDKAEDVTSTSEYLLWINPTSKPELNYQKYANKITSKWVAYKVPKDYYKKGGTLVGYMRDEVYAFAIQWLDKTGYWSPAYPIPGRKAESTDLDPVITNDTIEIRDPDYDGKTKPQTWQVYNTAYETSTGTKLDDRNIISEGKMGYWESSERYPDNKDLFEDLSCKPIRHHKFPDNTLTYLTDTVAKDDSMIILGVRFENIARPLDSEGNVRSDIVGYRIVRGDRFGNKSIVGKGLLYNTRSYNDDDGTEVLYPNYPFNDLRADQFLSQQPTKTSGTREVNYQALTKVNRDKFTFHGPAFSFNNPSLGTELKVEGEVVAATRGKFEEVYKHPKHKLVTNFAAGVASVIGIAEGYLAIKGRTCTATRYSLKITFPPAFDSEATTTKCDTALSKAGFGGIIGQILSAATTIVAGALAFGYYFSQGVDASLKVIKAFGAYQQYALQYNAYGYFNDYALPKLGSMRRRIVAGQYLIPGMVTANTTRFNNFNRESSVYLELDSPLDNPTNIDMSRKTMSECGQCGKDRVHFISQASCYYASVKNKITNQYGQLDSISYLDTGNGISYTNNTSAKIVSSGVIFGGDTYISRFTVKRKMPFFNQTLFDVPDGSELNYKNYPNVGYPRFWIDTDDYDSEEVLKIQLASTKHNFDCRNTDNKLFIIKGRYFYLYNSGISDFFVESEYNLENRDWDDTINGRHYDRYVYTDVKDLLRSDRILYDNKYIFDRTYLKPLNENFIGKQSRNYNPKLSESCYTTFKNRVIYSMPATKEQIKDNWRVYRPNNYHDFSKENGTLITAKTYGRDRLIFLFDKSSPYVTLGIDTLQTENGIKVSLGDGGLFDRQPQRLVYTDFAYGNTQSKWAFINTQYGGFYPSQRQGKVFMFTGDGIQDISLLGMSRWFKENLPCKLAEQFPNFINLDNPINGTAVISIYDNEDEIYYLSKIDYKIKSEFVGKTRYDVTTNKFYIGSTEVRFKDPRFFDDCSWTISYDVKEKSWVSFHDWHPEWTFQTERGFLTYKNRQLWKHSNTTTSFCNFYGKDYPFEIEFSVSNPGGQVATLSSLEWNLEALKYDTATLTDTFHLLDYNFDEMIIYNSEQNSGLLKLNPRPKSIDTPYPISYTNRTEIGYEKVEQKYRVNQFADLTRNRGEFNDKQIPMWTTQGNGYRKIFNRQYLDYLKDSFQRKKFRHMYHKVILRRSVNGNVKIIFKYNNFKQIASFR